MDLYNELLDALDEFRAARDKELPDYDPQNYSRDERNKRREVAKKRLDAVFTKIVHERGLARFH